MIFNALKDQVECLHLDLSITLDGRCINVWKNNTRVIEVMSHKVTFIEPFGKVGKPLYDTLGDCMSYLRGLSK